MQRGGGRGEWGGWSTDMSRCGWGVEGGEGEDDSPGEEAKIRKLHRMKVYL